jgi:hypothetical protein
MRPLQRAFSLLSAESLSEVLDMIGTGRSGQLSAKSLYVRLTRTGVRLPPSARSCWKMPANHQGQGASAALRGPLRTDPSALAFDDRRCASLHRLAHDYVQCPSTRNRAEQGKPAVQRLHCT